MWVGRALRSADQLRRQSKLMHAAQEVSCHRRSEGGEATRTGRIRNICCSLPQRGGDVLQIGHFE